jgi:hypothetical protein
MINNLLLSISTGNAFLLRRRLQQRPRRPGATGHRGCACGPLRAVPPHDSEVGPRPSATAHAFVGLDASTPIAMRSAESAASAAPMPPGTGISSRGLMQTC